MRYKNMGLKALTLALLVCGTSSMHAAIDHWTSSAMFENAMIGNSKIITAELKKFNAATSVTAKQASLDKIHTAARSMTRKKANKTAKRRASYDNARPEKQKKIATELNAMFKAYHDTQNPAQGLNLDKTKIDEIHEILSTKIKSSLLANTSKLPTELTFLEKRFQDKDDDYDDDDDDDDTKTKTYTEKIIIQKLKALMDQPKEDLEALNNVSTDVPEKAPQGKDTEHADLQQAIAASKTTIENHLKTINDKIESVQKKTFRRAYWTQDLVENQNLGIPKYVAPRLDFNADLKALTVPAGDVKGGTWYINKYKFPVAVENLKGMVIFSGIDNKVGINEPFLQAFKDAKDSFKADTLQSARDFISTLKQLKKIKKPSGLKASATKLSLEMTKVLNNVKLTDPPKQDPPKQDPPKQDPPKQDPPKSGDTGTKFAEYFKFPVAVENLKDMAIFTGTGNKVGINEAFLQAFKGAKDSFKSDTIQSARDFISTLKPLKKIKKPSGLKASATKLSLEMTQVLNSAAKK